MITRISADDLYTADRGWLKSRFHFSFAEYRDPDNTGYGTLLVLNDDIVQPENGFRTHPHNDMEIISYCVRGELTHQDSMGSKETLTRGDVQYMSAGTGITHSEMNDSPDKELRFLQIWILPDRTGYTPIYGSERFLATDRRNRLLHIVGEGSAISINQDANIYVTELDSGKDIEFQLKESRQAYIVCIEGETEINGTNLTERDAIKIADEGGLKISAVKDAHIIIIEMQKR